MSVDPKEMFIVLMAHLASCSREDCCLRLFLGPEFGRPLRYALPNVNEKEEA